MIATYRYFPFKMPVRMSWRLFAKNMLKLGAFL